MVRGEVWVINLDPTIGAEIRKSRPAVVVNDDAMGVLPLKVIVPLTDWKDRYRAAPWLVPILPSSTNGLQKPSGADAFQVRSVSEQRCFVRRLGFLSASEMEQVTAALAAVLSIR